MCRAPTSNKTVQPSEFTLLEKTCSKTFTTTNIWQLPQIKPRWKRLRTIILYPIIGFLTAQRMLCGWILPPPFQLT